MDVSALGYESLGFLRQSASSFVFLSLPPTVIVLSEDVDNCVCVSLRVCGLCATVCSIRSCLTCLAPYPRKWIISCPGSSQGGLCETLFWHGLINPTSFPFFLFPSFLPSLLSTPWAPRLIYLLDVWHDLSWRKSKQVHVLEIHSCCFVLPSTSEKVKREDLSGL